ncbi:isochorismate synthase [Saliphagus infecundisoli]|uniref:isochorismate synthase n=1 Tax=Saliphagus infecundisoli TaxID=1849069 RepID=A0ABD5QGG9_9EURY|nr:isochorismate synthase [Saliphagus infecundisoli]
MNRSSGDVAGETIAADPVGRSRELGDVSFGAVADVGEGAHVQWAAPDGLELLGRGVAAAFTAAGGNRIEDVRSAAAAFFDRLDHDGPPESRSRALGGLAFHADHGPTPPWTGFPAASFLVPRIQLTRTDRGTWLTAVGDGERAATDLLAEWEERLERLATMRPSGTKPGVERSRRPTSRSAWRERVEHALARIADGDLEKVVLAQTLAVELGEGIDVAATVERLRRKYPGCYRFLIDPDAGGRTFFGAPPERLVSMRGDRIETEALAGSVARGESPEEDEELADRMREDEKLEREHEVVVRAIQAQLSPIAADVSVGERTVRRLATIQHLRTPITARAGAADHVLDVVGALHPTPAVGGLPPDPAIETIRAVEGFDRGWYAAPIGWFDAEGDGEFAVGIRSGVASEREVTLFAGNGIVADSDPDEEWAEIQLKFRPVLDELER